MQLESLKMFCDVVETGSFSRAAQLNHVTQSAVSQQIRALENRYEQKLLSRSARQVTPTPAGERLFRGCKEILARFAEVEAEIREQSTEVQGTSTVSTIYSVGLHELQNVQKQLLKTHPKVNMRLNYRRNDQVYDDIILGAAEIGIVAYPQPRAGVDILPFRDDKLGVVCAPNHSFATKSKVSLAALSGVPFIAFDREAPGRDAVHWANGNGTIVAIDGGHALRLEADFETGPGPNYWIYLNTRAVGEEKDFVADAGRVRLAKLRAFKGAQNYVLPAGLEATGFHTVTIWCETFGAYIGSAVLERAAPG